MKPNSIGHVSVEAAGTTTFTPATDGEALHVGDTVQTDSVGLAEIDYAADSYTRLDVNTTFTITKLTDSQGNRQVNGTLQTGQTWNRTVALTQSESFQQQGAGTTAAVAGTAFVVDCTSPTQCTFTGVIDNVTLTGSNGQTQTLNPLNQCVSTSGNLCATPSQLTPDQVALIQWIQTNVFLDLVEHGLGNGIFDPFGGTVAVTNGVVQSFTPSTPGQDFTPPAPPSTPPAPPAVDQNQPINAGATYRGPGQDTTGGCAASPPAPQDHFAAAAAITVGDDCSVDFVLNVQAVAARPFFIHFTQIDSQIGASPLLGRLLVTNDPFVAPGEVDTSHLYQPGDVFTFASNDPGAGPETGNTNFSYQAVDAGDPAVSSAIVQVQVTVQADCDDPPAPEPGCLTSTATSTSHTSSAASVTPATVATTPTTAMTTPPTTPPTTPTTTSPATP